MKAHISHTAKSTAQGLVWGIQPGSADWQALEAAAVPFGMALRAVAPSQADSTVSRLLGGNNLMLLGNLIEMQFVGTAYNPHLGSAISLVMMVVVVICMAVMNRFGEGEEQAVIL